MTTQTCGTCRHWFTTPALAGKAGNCRRMPPVPLANKFLIGVLPTGEQVMQGSVDSFFPMIGVGGSCGEWAPRSPNGIGFLPSGFSPPKVGDADPIPQPTVKDEGTA